MLSKNKKKTEKEFDLPTMDEIVDQTIKEMNEGKTLRLDNLF